MSQESPLSEESPVSEESPQSSEFEHRDTFIPGELSGTLGLGPLEAEYEELFAEALADGVITAEERARLERAAENLGIDKGRLVRLEQAMLSAYQSRHKVRIVEHYEEPARSLDPIRVEADGDAGRAFLLKRVEQLEGRVRELEAELGRARAAVNVEVDLREVEDAAVTASEDPDVAWRRVRHDPTSVEALRNLYRIYSARGEIDKTFCVSQALVLLGAPSDAERSTYHANRRETLIAPRASVSASAWQDFLFHPEQELLTGQIFGAIAPSVLVGRVTALRREGTLRLPPPEALQDPAKATLTAVRAIPWAAAILGLKPPPIYLEKDRDIGYAHVPAVPPLSVVGAKVLGGKTQLEHAFLVGRHLAFYRAENYIKTLYRAVPDLEDLFLSALTIGNPGLPIAEPMRRRVAPIAEAIQPLLEASQVDTLRGCFLRFVEEGGRTNLLRFSKAVEKTACRAGLLLGNDLITAAGILEEEEGPLGELSKDLIAFVSSERYFKLRRQLGIALDAEKAS